VNGRLDLLVNNAGISIEDGQPATRVTAETFLQMMDVNVNALFFLTQLVARIMLEQKAPSPTRRGNIINISSIHGMHASAPNFQVAGRGRSGSLAALSFAVVHQNSLYEKEHDEAEWPRRPRRFQVAYSSSKAAVNNMTRELAIQCASGARSFRPAQASGFDSLLSAGLWNGCLRLISRGSVGRGGAGRARQRPGPWLLPLGDPSIAGDAGGDEGGRGHGRHGQRPGPASPPRGSRPWILLFRVY
jgi:hypothetical protein